MSFAINHSFKRPAFPAPADGQGSIPTADARGAGRGLVRPHTNPQSAGAVTNHSSVASEPRAPSLPAGSGSEGIPASTQSATTKGVRDAKFEHHAVYPRHLIDRRRPGCRARVEAYEPAKPSASSNLPRGAEHQPFQETTTDKAPAESAADEISVTNSHPQSTSSPIAVTAGEDAAPPVSSPALPSTAGERSVRFAIWPSPLPCRAAGGEGIRADLINRIPTRESRLPAHSEAA